MVEIETTAKMLRHLDKLIDREKKYLEAIGGSYPGWERFMDSLVGRREVLMDRLRQQTDAKLRESA